MDCPKDFEEIILFEWQGIRDGCVCQKNDSYEFHENKYCMIEANEKECDFIDS